MRRKSRISFGPGAASIILIVVVLSMSVLALLTLVNARNDRRLSDRSAQVVEAVYALDEQAERMFADLDNLVLETARTMEGADQEKILDAVKAALPAGVALDGDTLSWTVSDELRDLACAAAITLDGTESTLAWIKHRLTMRTEDTWNLGIF